MERLIIGDVIRCIHPDHLDRIGVVISDCYVTDWQTLNYRVKYTNGEEQSVCEDYLKKVNLE